jgi:outer membrane biosynthesis protein TonB
VSYQREERYWTDYVRVATPIVGLLLLLGVFWYWASSLIGADSEEPPPTTVASITVVADPTDTPTPTEEPVIEEDNPEPTATEAEAEPTEEATEEPTAEERPERTPTEEEPAEEPTEEVSEGRFAEGEVILSMDDNVNMRDQPSTAGEIVEVLSLDQELTVLDGQPREGDGYVWWNVQSNDSGNTGWVVDDWLKLQE